MSELVTVEVMTEEHEGPLRADTYDYERLPPELRDQAMLAQGTVLTKLGGAVERVIDAGNTLRWAKTALPHGEYLPWVRRACGLKPKYAALLVQAAEWTLNVQHAGHLQGIKDTTTLFLLSADATPEEVREWVMESCAAGDPPTREEVQERKRQAQGKTDRTVIQEALSALKLSIEARQLAAKAEHISTRQLMDELGVDELPKGKEHQANGFTFCKNGTGWWKLPIAREPEQSEVDLVPVAVAAERMGQKVLSLSSALSVTKAGKRNPPRGNGWQAEPHPARGMCVLKRIT